MREYLREYFQRPEVKVRQREYMRAYNQRPEVIARRLELAQRPEVIADRREYFTRPDVKERRKQVDREYYQRPEVIAHQREYQLEYNQRPDVKARNKERDRYSKEYYATPRGKAIIDASEQRRRGRLLNIEGTFTADEWAAKLATANGRCTYCGEEAALTMDHVVPVSRGGTNWIDNLVPACGPCNFSKGTSDVDEWMTRTRLRDGKRL